MINQETGFILAMMHIKWERKVSVSRFPVSLIRHWNSPSLSTLHRIMGVNQYPRPGWMCIRKLLWYGNCHNVSSQGKLLIRGPSHGGVHHGGGGIRDTMTLWWPEMRGGEKTPMASPLSRTLNQRHSNLRLIKRLKYKWIWDSLDYWVLSTWFATPSEGIWSNCGTHYQTI